MDKLLNKVCEYYCVSPEMVKSRNRGRKYVKARQMFCLLAIGHKSKDIAFMVNFTRCNVNWSTKTIRNDMKHDNKLRQDYEILCKG